MRYTPSGPTDQSAQPQNRGAFSVSGKQRNLPTMKPGRWGWGAPSDREPPPECAENCWLGSYMDKLSCYSEISGQLKEGGGAHLPLPQTRH